MTTAVGAAVIMADSCDAVRDTIRDAAARGTRLRVLGAGTWHDAGRPVAADATLSLAALVGVVDYVPGDLTITARAGTPLTTLQTIVRAEGQVLPLDPWGGDAGTLGATLATAAAGPLSGSLGLPRDTVLGVQTVTGVGDVVRGGGRVVKNVAGFDLVRLMIGAWGTLGVITEATVRLRALPDVDTTLAVAVSDAALDDVLARVRALPVSFAAAELLDDDVARQLDLPAGTRLLVRLGGNADAVAAQRMQVAALGDAVDVAVDVWARLRTLEPRDAAVARLSARPARLALPWAEARRVSARIRGAGDRAWAHASVTRGVVRLVMPDTPDMRATLAGALGPRAPRDVTRIFERLPAALWAALAPSTADDRLSRGVRAAFDPQGILNPGILGTTGRDG